MRLVEIDCAIVRETEKAYLIDDGTQRIWVPKSQVEWHVEPRKPGGFLGTMVMPEDMAYQKGLI